ncbi:MAG: diacylglycerol kinase [Legionella sp.]|nr:MAG: diacylglycerol kinase [Legionella sp.]
MNELAIVINNHAKNATQGSQYLDALREANIPFQLYEVESDELETTLENCLKNHNTLLIGGGDGTIRTAAQYCAKTTKVMGVLPLGTLNHFAKELDLPQTVEELIAAVKEKCTQQIDLAEVNGLIFVNNSSIGFYPKFADKRDHYSKSYNKWLSYIPSLIEGFRKHKAYKVEIKSKTKRLNLKLRTSFLMVSNNVYTYEFPITIKRDNFQESCLGLYFYKSGTLKILKIIKGLFNKNNDFEVHKCTAPLELHFQDHQEMNISLDGDTMKVKTPLHYQSLPQSLTLLTKASCA